MSGLEIEIEDEEQPLEVKPEERRVIWQPKDYSIFELHRQHQRGGLNLQPEFQRFSVWDDTKACRLIESILSDVPIRTIYLTEEQNGTYAVVDGQQRLTSFFRFLTNDLKLRKLMVMGELNGKNYRDLPKELQDKLEKATIHTIIINKESQPDIKFEIFERLNTGAVHLNDQELRNCMYRGSYNKLLEELSADTDFLSLLGLRKPDSRMRDRELVLRFFALHRSTHLNFRPPMKRFLNEEMQSHQNMSETEQRQMKDIFRNSIELSRTVFGDKSFKRFVPGNEKDPNGQWEGRVNKALYDIVMFGFAKYPKSQIVPRSDAVREELIWLMTQDNEFTQSLIIGTNDAPRVFTRFQKWINALQEIAGSPSIEPRNFSSQFKQQLWTSEPTCKICGQRIQLSDDSEVDHVEFYWRGGKTIPSNARIVHRYCNRSRGGRGSATTSGKAESTEGQQLTTGSTSTNYGEDYLRDRLRRFLDQNRSGGQGMRRYYREILLPLCLSQDFVTSDEIKNELVARGLAADEKAASDKLAFISFALHKSSRDYLREIVQYDKLDDGKKENYRINPKYKALVREVLSQSQGTPVIPKYVSEQKGSRYLPGTSCIQLGKQHNWSAVEGTNYVKCDKCNATRSRSL